MVNRTVVGAHYGLRDWLVQRVTAALMALFTLAMLAVLVAMPPGSHEAWRSLFASRWMRLATLLFVISLAWHAWAGLRDVLMDYVKGTGVRLASQLVVILTVCVYVAWAIQILWR